MPFSLPSGDAGDVDVDEVLVDGQVDAGVDAGELADARRDVEVLVDVQVDASAGDVEVLVDGQVDAGVDVEVLDGQVDACPGDPSPAPSYTCGGRTVAAYATFCATGGLNGTGDVYTMPSAARSCAAPPTCAAVIAALAADQGPDLSNAVCRQSGHNVTCAVTAPGVVVFTCS